MKHEQPEPQPHLWDGTPMAAMPYVISKENSVPTNHDETLCGERELALVAKVEAQARRIAAMEKDAARYLWLRNNWFTMGAAYPDEKVKFYTNCTRWSDQPETNIDEAVDAELLKDQK